MKSYLTLPFQKLRLIWAVTFISLYTASISGQTNEFRAFWATSWHAGFKSGEQVSKLVADIRKANCNAVFVQVRRRGDAFYNNSPYEPKAADTNLVSRDFDSLADLITKAHDTNAGPRIEVHAWFITYPISTGTVPTNSAHPYNLHRDWLSQANTGDTYDNQNYYFDPGHPEVQNYIYNVAMDIISRYDIDGFHFDHLHYPSPQWGYNPVAVERFNKRFNREGQPKPEDPQWKQFRREQVTALLRKIYLSSIALKPQIKISAATYTSTPVVGTESDWLTKSPAYTRKLQDWKAWMSEGILDMNVPMNFFKQSGKNYADAFQTWNTYLKDHRYERHLVIGIGAFENSISNTLQQIESIEKPTPKGNKADGFALYSYSVPVAARVSPSEFTQIISKPGPATVGISAPFTAPVTVPIMPWKATPTNGHLKGTVHIGSSANAVDGASIELVGQSKRRLVADATGFYGAADLAPGDYTQIISSPGFLSQTNRVTIKKGFVASADVVLAPSKTK